MGDSSSSDAIPYHPSTLAIHADDDLATSAPATDIAPPLHTSTTFSYPGDPAHLVPAADLTSAATYHIYSRHTAPTSTRLELLLATLIHAPTLTYSSGLSALFAAYTLLNPKRVAITGGYHGAYGVLGLHTRLSGLQVLPLDCAESELRPGDVIHVETPVNPSGEARNLAHYSAKAKTVGAVLLVDATFGPPGLQDPFDFGADIVMHSGTKYLGGHSDMLCGVLATRNQDYYAQLLKDRLFLGSVMGSLEGWLGVRSIRTLELRVAAASQNAEKLVLWLSGCVEGATQYPCVEQMGADVQKVVASVSHASVQSKDDLEWIRKQMPGGFGPVFAIMARSEGLARRLPSKLRLFGHATSLGGVESLVEWRAMSDATVDRKLLRFSIGIERWEDLRADIWNACKELILEGV